MPTAAKNASDHAVPFAVASVSRKPQQGRSKASLERMLIASREMMLERGSEEFTLQEVSQRGSVSIGSIYLRFESKDNLVRAVIANALEDIVEDEDAMFAKLSAECGSLGEFIPRYVDDFAEMLRRNAPLLRLAMARAAYDPLISGPGKDSALKSEESAKDAMLRFGGEIKGDDPAKKAKTAYMVVFAALARELSLGSTDESAHNYDWGEHKTELGKMCLAYLRAD
jgi:AcrR family transcriptional regulator